MTAIELTSEQERTLAREGVVELHDLVVMTVEAYRRNRAPRSGLRLRPDPPLQSVETLPPVELPLSGEPRPVAPTIPPTSRLLSEPYPTEEA